MENFSWIIFAHAIGDMGLQTCYMSDHKHDKFNVMLAHCIIWAGCIGVALTYLGIYSFWKMPFLVIAHFLTDRWSSRHPERINSWNKINTIDQLIHLGQIIVVFIF